MDAEDPDVSVSRHEGDEQWLDEHAQRLEADAKWHETIDRLRNHAAVEHPVILEGQRMADLTHAELIDARDFPIVDRRWRSKNGNVDERNEPLRRQTAAYSDVAGMFLGATVAASNVHELVTRGAGEYRPFFDAGLTWPQPTGAAASAIADGQWASRSWQRHRVAIARHVDEGLAAIPHAAMRLYSGGPTGPPRPVVLPRALTSDQRQFIRRERDRRARESLSIVVDVRGVI